MQAAMNSEVIEALATENYFDLAAFSAYVAYHDIEDEEEAVERFQDEYAGTHDDLTGWAEDYMENSGMLAEMPENLRRYFDFEAFARDADLNGDVYGLHLDNGRLAVFYDGR